MRKKLMTASSQQVLKFDEPGKSKVNTGSSKPHYVARISPSVEFIRRYANMHGKEVSRGQVIRLWGDIEKAATEKRIRKSDHHAEAIESISEQLCKLYNSMIDAVKVPVEIDNVEKYKAIGYSQVQKDSVKLLKRYVNLVGSYTEQKARRLHADIGRAMRTKQVKNNDALKEALHVASRNLFNSYGEGKGLAISPTELRGLEGLGIWNFVAKAVASKVIGNRVDRLLQKSKPVGSAEFDPTFKNFKGKPKEAIKHLLKVKKGQCVGALIHPEIGDIDIVWGEHSKKGAGYGLCHIVAKHGKEIEQLGYKVEDFIPIVVQFGNLVKRKEHKNKIFLESETFRVVILTKWNGKEKIFLLSAFDLRPVNKKKALGAIESAFANSLSVKTLPLPPSAGNKDTENVPKPGTLEGFVRADQRSQISAPETFVLPGEVGRFLQRIPPFKYAIVLTGDPHAGKTEFAMQLLNAFLEYGKTVALFDIEQGGIESELTREAIDRNISVDNQQRLFVKGAAEQGIETLKQNAEMFDVIALDSWQKLNLPNHAFDQLREEFPRKIWVVISQQNGEGGTKGGVAIDYDTPVKIKVHKVDKTFVNNFAELEKNRGNKLDIKYMIASKKSIPLSSLVDQKKNKKGKLR